MLRAILICLLVVVLAAAGVAWWFFSNLNTLAADAIRERAPKVTGVAVALDAVNLSVTDGRGTLSGLTLGNPPGFGSGHALKLASATLAIDAASVGSDVVKVREILIASPDLQVELGPQGTNLQVIQRNIEAYVKRTNPSSAPGSEAGKPAKRFIIDRVLIQGARARIINPKADGEPLEIKLPDLELMDIGKAKGGATGAEVAQAIVGVLASKTAEAAAKSALQRKLESLLPDSVRGLFK